jgi:hypothetical protein
MTPTQRRRHWPPYVVYDIAMIPTVPTTTTATSATVSAVTTATTGAASFAATCAVSCALQKLMLDQWAVQHSMLPPPTWHSTILSIPMGIVTVAAASCLVYYVTLNRNATVTISSLRSLPRRGRQRQRGRRFLARQYSTKHNVSTMTAAPLIATATTLMLQTPNLCKTIPASFNHTRRMSKNQLPWQALIQVYEFMCVCVYICLSAYTKKQRTNKVCNTLFYSLSLSYAWLSLVHTNKRHTHTQLHHGPRVLCRPVEHGEWKR